MNRTSAGKWVFLAAVLMNVVGTLLSPILAGVSHSWAGFHLHTYYIILFSLQGLDWGSHLRRSWWRGNVSRYTIPFTPGLREISTICNCFTSLKRKYIFIPFSALNVVVSAWAPPQERFRLIWYLPCCSYTLKMRRFNLYSGLWSIFLTLYLTITTLAKREDSIFFSRLLSIFLTYLRFKLIWSLPHYSDTLTMRRVNLYTLRLSAYLWSHSHNQWEESIFILDSDVSFSLVYRQVHFVKYCLLGSLTRNSSFHALKV